ncbi:hypothetical protein [Herpetosiphon giganteus]|uniref:hypothetical protein n=1 Tax=Herpetosiphon giganteus TaxID=2029754 RepID=UPI0019594950|nr:hypothetical protein [Herpetosiphon giganteus]MBM7841591.1 hypothetical protein [Herpetosiphon giganteus]
MRLYCLCGTTLVDSSTTDLFYNKGWVLPHYSALEFDEAYLPIAVDYVEAVEQGRKTEWIANHYPPEHLPISHHEVLVTYAAWNDDQSLFLYECDRCQRLWISHPHAEGYFAFKPDLPEQTPRDFLGDPRADAEQSTPADNEER